MNIHASIYKQKVNNSYSIKFNQVEHFLLTDFENLILKIDKKQILIDDKHSFFLQNPESKNIFRVYIMDFRDGLNLYSFPLLEDYTGIPPVKIAGTIEFK